MTIDNISNYIIIAVCVVLILVHEFSDFIPQLEGHENSLIILAILVTAGRSWQRIDELYERSDKAREAILSNLDALKLIEAGIISEVRIPRVFDDFIGEEYYAYNAPLQYEIINLTDRLGFHIKRYQSTSFKKAHYYYPIFASDKSREWMIGVLKFYKKLNNDHRLSPKQKQKLIFYVPSENYVFQNSSNIRPVRNINSGQKNW